MTHQEAQQLINYAIEELFRKDPILLVNDVSERSITHKFAEYLQTRVPNLNVDCEYNRNVELGERAPKLLNMLSRTRNEEIGERIVRDIPEEDLEAYSTFPDIIVHRRGTNDENILIIEAKKQNSRVRDDFDFAKLCAFTDDLNGNNYRYEHGVFVKFVTGSANPARPRLIWFANGRQREAN